jgi:hypothetical protein
MLFESENLFKRDKLNLLNGRSRKPALLTAFCLRRKNRRKGYGWCRWRGSRSGCKYENKGGPLDRL